MEVLRVAVNVGQQHRQRRPGDQPGADDDASGTGFVGRSPRWARTCSRSHLVNWTRLAYNRDPAEPFGDFSGLDPVAGAAAGPVPPYPVASNQRGDRPAAASGGGQAYSPARSELNAIGRLGAP